MVPIISSYSGILSRHTRVSDLATHKGPHAWNFAPKFHMPTYHRIKDTTFYHMKGMTDESPSYATMPWSTFGLTLVIFPGTKEGTICLKNPKSF